MLATGFLFGSLCVFAALWLRAELRIVTLRSQLEIAEARRAFAQSRLDERRCP